MARNLALFGFCSSLLIAAEPTATERNTARASFAMAVLDSVAPHFISVTGKF